MENEEFKKLVMQSDDKIAVLTNLDIISKYKISLVDLCNITNEILSDEEKLEILKSPFYQRMKNGEIARGMIISSISNKEILLEIKDNETIMEGCSKDFICEVVRQLLTDGDKQTFLHNANLIETFDIKSYNLIGIAKSLNDEEKLKLLRESNTRDMCKFEAFDLREIVESLSDEAKIKLLKENESISALNIGSYGWQEIIKSLKDETKISILRDASIIKSCELREYELGEVIKSLDEDNRARLLMEKDFMTKGLKLSSTYLDGIIESLSDEENRYKLLKVYSDFPMPNVIASFNTDLKIKTLIESKCLSSWNILYVLRTLDTNGIIKLLGENKEFLKENQIDLYTIVYKLNDEEQLKFVQNIESANLTETEKKEILATLSPEVKDKIDISQMSEEYKKAINMQTKDGNIVIDLERNPEDYKGYDNLILVNPEGYTDEQRKKFMKICDICPKGSIECSEFSVMGAYSTAKEYKEAEAWIDSVIAQLKPEYTTAQKIAIIDNAIGKKISYSPDFDTEMFSPKDSRALWKIISSGYGVCNGIANVEHYILNKIGIESEIISSGGHSFLKLENIEVLLANGETKVGNTILDPTWNLAAHRFGGRPSNFFMSYEEARKHDIDSNGMDHECHKNDEKLSNATLNLDEQSLRNLFSSVGLAHENGEFLIKEMIAESTALHEQYANQPAKDLEQQFALLAQMHPEFAICQNSTMEIMSAVLLNNENLQFNKCVVNRVYDKQDEEKKPIVYTYIDSDEMGRRFYYADKDKGQMIGIPESEFVQRFECYDTDLAKTKGIRPWESSEKTKKDTDLSRGSGTIEASQNQENGEER
mgnify:FL=1